MLPCDTHQSHGKIYYEIVIKIFQTYAYLKCVRLTHKGFFFFFLKTGSTFIHSLDKKSLYKACKAGGGTPPSSTVHHGHS